MAFKEVDTKVAFPALEQEIEAWWKERAIIKQALGHGDRSKPFIFFEGPPTANGRPGVHHVEARASKDIIIRYHRMRGQYVIGARGGWDTHGLPVEIEVEKELGFNGKPDIEKYGIAEFNAACKASVQRYIAEWERMTDRIAFWIDMEDPYSTYDNSYIESLWWIMKSFWDRELLFRDYKVTMHCPRCGTSLSDHEVSLGFEDDVDDPSVWLRFRHRPSGHPLDQQLAGAAFLAWTTTPWTLPANVALAVKPGATYVLVALTPQPPLPLGEGESRSDGGEGEKVILAEALAESVLGEGNFTVLARFEGDALKDVCYERLFDGVPAPGEALDLEQTYRVVADDYVSLEDGSGIVHIAPAYGDLEIGRKYDLPTLFSVDLAGKTMPQFDTLGFGGLFFKQADPLITRNLSERGLLFRSGRVKHSYPFCWRCKTPLLYYAKPSWYIRTTAKKDRLLANNAQIDWVPEHIQTGRFGNWLANNIDWALSRERYWGTPLPIWISADGQHMECLGSLAELEQKAGRSLKDLDLHRPYVDEITWEDPQYGTMRRIPDVADCWFDSGAMPVAQWHYPFENQELFETAGQADYISEAIDQTRGWFYTLHALSTLLFDRPAYQHCICLGHILDVKGEKMSKSRGNVVDPWDLLNRYGADATRWYMYASAPPYNPRRFAPEHVGEVLRQFMLTLWNTYAFFVTYANLDGWVPETRDVRLEASNGDSSLKTQASSLTAVDRWALARLNALVRDVTEMFDNYDIHGPAKAIESFVEELSNWYVRRNRRRFWKAEDDADKQAAYSTLYTCLTTLTRLLAPFMPFVSEAMYRNLMGLEAGGLGLGEGATQASSLQPPASVPESVHLAPWPSVATESIDEDLLVDTAVLLEAISLGRAARRGAGLKVRQPLGELWVRVPSRSVEGLRRFEAELRDELNVKSIRYLDSSVDLVEYRFKPNLRLVGKKYGKLVPALTAALRDLSGEAARAVARGVEGGSHVSLSVDGQEVDLLPEEVLVESSSPEGYAVAESGRVLVALDTTMTPELRQEGIARELVRNIQDARKSAGFAIADRIRVHLGGVAGDAELETVVRQWGDYIRAETLADDLLLDTPAATSHVETLDLDGRAVQVGVARVA
jgi:isoleucyl-tRNA synthetase